MYLIVWKERRILDVNTSYIHSLKKICKRIFKKQAVKNNGGGAGKLS